MPCSWREEFFISFHNIDYQRISTKLSYRFVPIGCKLTCNRICTDMKEVPPESVFMLITGSHGIINRNWRTGVKGKKPEYLRSANGPEFRSEKIQTWLKKQHITPQYIRPGSPWQNGHVESLNASWGVNCRTEGTSFPCPNFRGDWKNIAKKGLIAHAPDSLRHYTLDKQSTNDNQALELSH